MTDSLLDKIVRVSVDLIEQFPGNPRVGDIEAIMESLAENQQFAPIVVQQSTGYIVSGNHTYRAACELGWDEIDVVYVDVDDTQAKRILLAANKIADRGTYDERLLADLLADILDESDALLEGTGYTADEVDDLLAASTAFELPDDEGSEDVGLAAAVLDRIMPGNDEEYDDIEDGSDDLLEGTSESSTPAPVTDTIGNEPVEFVIFRFGELRAKVPRQTYERFVRGFLKEHSGDLSLAGVSAAVKLGIDSESVEPAVAQGAERWL
jgi:ParB-like chromosome segregation protein Spo0J